MLHVRKPVKNLKGLLLKEKQTCIAQIARPNIVKLKKDQHNVIQFKSQNWSRAKPHKFIVPSCMTVQPLV
jgi:hypothetical protein